MRLLNQCFWLFLVQSSVCAVAFARDGAKLTLYRPEGPNSVKDRVSVIVELSNEAKQPLIVLTSPTFVAYEPAGAAALPHSDGSDAKVTLEIVVETAPLDASKITIDKAQVLEASGGHVEPWIEQKIDSGSSVLIKTSLPSGIAPPDTRRRVKCRLRRGSDVIATSKSVTLEYRQ
jgi:hypothetical protein